MAGKCPEDIVDCVVQAECEDLKPYLWEGQMRATEPFSALAAAWAAEYKVPAGAVGFDALDGKEVSMSSTPLDLGWRAGAKLELRSYPMDETYKEQLAPGDATAPAIPATTAAPSTIAAAATAGKGNPQETRVQTEPIVMPSPPTADDPTPKAAVAKQDTKQPTPKQATPPKQASPKKTMPKATPKATLAPATVAPKSEPQKKASWQKATPQAPPAALPSGSASSAGKRKAPGSPFTPSRAASSEGKRKAPGSPFTPSGNLPEGDERISFQLENPKNMGSQSFIRYEKYKRATTVNEAKRLGAASGDISYDFKRGFLKRL